MNYATGYGVVPKQLYTSFKVENIDINHTRHLNKNKKKVCGSIFTYCMLQILNDIIDNNVIFQLPVNTEAYIEMNSIHGEDFKKARQNGAFEDVNLTTSHFTGNQLHYRVKYKLGWKKKSIKVNKKLKNKITEHTNAGKNYN